MNLLTPTFSLLFVLSLCLASPLRALLGAEPDPQVLLQGVQSARSVIRSGEISLRVVYEDDVTRTEQWLSIAFDGDLRHYSALQRAGAGQVVYQAVHNGAEVMVYRDQSAILDDPHKGRPEYLFDPRLLGLAVSPSASKTIGDALTIQRAKEVRLVGAEKINNVTTWHISTVDQYDQQHHYWVEDAPFFPVHQYEFRYRDSRRICISQYASHPVTSALPQSIEIRSLKEGALVYTRNIEVVDVKLNVPVDAALFTLAGLDMEPGTPVSDIRIKKRIGYWDGRELVETPAGLGGMANQSQQRPVRRGHRWLGFASLILVSILLVAAHWLRRQWPASR